jgi:hypothetical protein
VSEVKFRNQANRKNIALPPGSWMPESRIPKGLSHLLEQSSIESMREAGLSVQLHEEDRFLPSKYEVTDEERDGWY